MLSRRMPSGRGTEEVGEDVVVSKTWWSGAVEAVGSVRPM